MENKDLQNTSESGNIMNETAFRQKILEAAEEEGEYYEKLNEQLKNDPEYQLTPEKLEAFEKRLRRARRNPFRAVRSCGPHTYRRLNKVAVILSALLVILIVGVVSVSSLRDYTINFLLGLNDTHGDIYVMDGLLLKTDGYAPTVLPEGYHFLSLQTIDDSSIITYVDDNNGMLTFAQRSADNTGTIDTEESEVKEVSVNGYDGRLSFGEDGIATLVWKTEDYLFSLSSTDGDTDLIPIAESVSK